MPEQLIFTSAPRGLQAGRSGYCTVARSHDLQEGLIYPLEQASTYTHLVLPGQEASVRNPTIQLYRKLKFAGTEYRILSQIIDTGADHTGRSNYLAHHLIFDSDWQGLPSPASILRWWNGWKKDPWVDAPRYLDAVSPEEFRALGQSGDVPRATMNEYLALGWESTFTTFLQSNDSQNDFTWMGTREEPNAASRIADLKLFGLTAEEQSTKLNDFSGLISAPEGDERTLLERFELTLGQRSQAAEQQALVQAQESLDNEFRNIEQLSVRLEGGIKGIQNKSEDFKNKYASACSFGKPMQLYQNCLNDHINLARDAVADHEAKRLDVFNKAKADYQAARGRIGSGHFPEIGIASDSLKSLSELESLTSECSQKLIYGIQKFEDRLNEYNEEENLRLVKEAEERRTEEVQKAISRGGTIGTASDYEFQPEAPSRSRWLLPVVGIACLLIIVLAAVAIKLLDEPINQYAKNLRHYDTRTEEFNDVGLDPKSYKWWSFIDNTVKPTFIQGFEVDSQVEEDNPLKEKSLVKLNSFVKEYRKKHPTNISLIEKIGNSYKFMVPGEGNSLTVKRSKDKSQNKRDTIFNDDLYDKSEKLFDDLRSDHIALDDIKIKAKHKETLKNLYDNAKKELDAENQKRREKEKEKDEKVKQNTGSLPDHFDKNPDKIAKWINTYEEIKNDISELAVKYRGEANSYFNEQKENWECGASLYAEDIFVDLSRPHQFRSKSYLKEDFELLKRSQKNPVMILNSLIHKKTQLNFDLKFLEIWKAKYDILSALCNIIPKEFNISFEDLEKKASEYNNYLENYSEKISELNINIDKWQLEKEFLHAKLIKYEADFVGKPLDNSNTKHTLRVLDYDSPFGRKLRISFNTKLVKIPKYADNLNHKVNGKPIKELVGVESKIYITSVNLHPIYLN